MKLNRKKIVLVLIIVSLLAGYYLYQKCTSEILRGVLIIIIFVSVPILIVVTMSLWTKCPRCRRYGTIQLIGSELKKKGIDPDLPPDRPIWKEEETSLDLSIDIYDLFCRYRCEYCSFEWEEKPPPTYRIDSPPPPHENGSDD